jgi:hypothetical protein
MADERERQTSNKAGVKSLAKKMANSRHGFEAQPAASKTDGAFGREGRGDAEDSTEPGPGATTRAKSDALGRMKKG